MLTAHASNLRRALLPIAENESLDPKVRLVAIEHLIQLLIMAWEDKRAKQKHASRKQRAKKKGEQESPAPPAPRDMPTDNALGVS